MALLFGDSKADTRAPPGRNSNSLMQNIFIGVIGVCAVTAAILGVRNTVILERHHRADDGICMNLNCSDPNICLYATTEESCILVTDGSLACCGWAESGDTGSNGPSLTPGPQSGDTGSGGVVVAPSGY